MIHDENSACASFTSVPSLLSTQNTIILTIIIIFANSNGLFTEFVTRKSDKLRLHPPRAAL